ncbi:MAG: hypothetical protein ABI475_07065 [Methylophilaceae bacterium]
MTAIAPFTTRVIWHALEIHCQKVHELHLLQLYADDLVRGECMTADDVGNILALRNRNSKALLYGR